MPGFDGTGPRGRGPMTGGGRGFCNPQFRGMGSPYMDHPQAMPYGWGYPYGGNPYGAPSFAPYQAFPYRPFGYGGGFGRGFGMGRGRGRGW